MRRYASHVQSVYHDEDGRLDHMGQDKPLPDHTGQAGLISHD